MTKRPGRGGYREAEDSLVTGSQAYDSFEREPWREIMSFFERPKDSSIRRVAAYTEHPFTTGFGGRFAHRGGVSPLPGSGLFVPDRVCSRLRARRL